jgi:hypothetical protein
MTDIKQYLVGDITDTIGASRYLTERLGHSVGVDSVHKLVREGRLRAWMFQDGELIAREPKSSKSRGKDLIFLKADLQGLRPVKRGNPDIANLHKSRKKVKIDSKNT